MPSPKAAFETISKNKGLSAVVGSVVLAAASLSTFFHMRSEGALEGVSQQIKTAKVDQKPQAQLVGGVAEFKNTLTGTKGRFELMGRDEPASGKPCFSVGITDGDYTLVNSSITDGTGRVHKVAQVTRVCP